MKNVILFAFEGMESGLPHVIDEVVKGLRLGALSHQRLPDAKEGLGPLSDCVAELQDTLPHAGDDMFMGLARGFLV